MLDLELDLDLDSDSSGGGPPANAAPTDIAWAGVHTVAEDAAVGTVVGGALSFTDPDSSGGTFTMLDGSDGRFGIGANGISVIVTGALDFEYDASHNITIRFTDDGDPAQTYDEIFAVTVTDVTEQTGTPPDIGPEDVVGVEVADSADFDVQPVVTEIDFGIAFHGKKKNTGATAKLLIDIGPAEANKLYTMRYDPDFSLMANGGVTALIGYGMVQGNNFHMVGLKGDGSSGLDKFKAFGTNAWNQGSGYSTSNGGDAAVGPTQGGPSWVQFRTAADGTTYDYKSLNFGGSGSAGWNSEYSAAAPSPFGNVNVTPTKTGPAALFDTSDNGDFRCDVALWASDPVAIEEHSAELVLLTSFEGTSPLADLTGRHTLTGTIDTTAPLFGTRAAHSTNGANGIVVPNSADFQMGSGVFSIEYGFRSTLAASTADPFSAASGGANRLFIIRHQGNGDIDFHISTDGTAFTTITFTGGAVGQTDNQYYRYRITRSTGNVFRLWRDGVFIAAVTQAVTMFAGSSDLSLNLSASGQQSFMDAVRVYKGYDISGNSSANYTLDTAMFPIYDGQPVISSTDTVYALTGVALSHTLVSNIDGAVIWLANGGADASKFEIIGNVLRWLANTTRTTGSPQDADSDNAYVVDVRALDPTTGKWVDQTITVTVSETVYSTTWFDALSDGDRRSLVVMTTTAGISGNIENLVNGTIGTDLFFSGGESSREIKIDFGVGATVVIDGIGWRQDAGSAQGTWELRGSNDDSSYTTIGASFLLVAVGQALTFNDFINSTPYRYYKLVQVSGVTSSAPWLMELYLRATSTSEGRDLLEKGDRTSLITVTSNWTPTTGSSITNLVDGDYAASSAASSFWPANGESSREIKFALAAAKKITDFIWVQSGNASHGTWKMAGSNDDSGYTDLGSSFTLGSTATGMQKINLSNSTPYLFYKLIQTAGTTNSAPLVHEIEFVIIP